MKRFHLLLITALACFQTPLQSQDDKSEREAVKSIITQLFDGMRKGDSSLVKSLFMKDATLASSFIGPDGKPNIGRESVSQFIEMVGTPHEEVYDEKIWSYDINIDGTLATAWTEYTFYLGDKMSHCGINDFVLHKENGGWKIYNITDTRRRNGCREVVVDSKQEINDLLDSWHRAAATADEATFFGSMTDHSIYIGTDTSEHWTKEVFEEWSKKYFERDSAWDFKVMKRNIFFSESGRTAWFDELLDTWMGPCRASGVLEYQGQNGWKINHYHLSVTVPNDKIEGFIELMKE